MGTKLYSIVRSRQPVIVQSNRSNGNDVPFLRLQLQHGKVALRLSMMVILLTLAHTVSLVLFYYRPQSNAVQLHRLFNLGVDGNVPTLFSAFILLSAAGLLYFLSRWAKNAGNTNDGKRWLLLSGIFVFLAVDEGAMIHDFLTETIRSRMPGTLPGFLQFSWVIPYLIFALGTGIFFIPFMLKLPLRTRNLIILSGCLYVGGALGFEMLESSIVANANAAGIMTEEVRPFSFYVLETFEEVLEMGAIVLFIYALLDYMKIKNARAEWRAI